MGDKKLSKKQIYSFKSIDDYSACIEDEDHCKELLSFYMESGFLFYLDGIELIEDDLHHITHETAKKLALETFDRIASQAAASPYVH